VVIVFENNVYSIISINQYENHIKRKVKKVKVKYDAVAAALALKKDMEKKGLTRAEYARMVGCSRANITKRLRHLKKLNKNGNTKNI
jgi:Fic family protein